MRMLTIALLCAAATLGCKSKEEPKGSVDKPAADDVDTQFLIDECVEAGKGETGCRGVGDEAAKLGKVIVDKLRNAPESDAEAIKTYYTADEINTLVAFMRSAEKTCEIK